MRTSRTLLASSKVVFLLLLIKEHSLRGFLSRKKSPCLLKTSYLIPSFREERQARIAEELYGIY